MRALAPPTLRFAALLLLALPLAACDSDPATCPATGSVTVEDLEVGTGQTASPFGTVSVIYAGRVAGSATAFDSTAVPRRFSLTSTIPGFRIGIGGGIDVAPMRIGGRRRIAIPATFAYGAYPPTAAIPSCADLVFDVRLVDF